MMMRSARGLLGLKSLHKASCLREPEEVDPGSQQIVIPASLSLNLLAVRVLQAAHTEREDRRCDQPAESQKASGFYPIEVAFWRPAANSVPHLNTPHTRGT